MKNPLKLQIQAAHAALAVAFKSLEAADAALVDAACDRDPRAALERAGQALAMTRHDADQVHHRVCALKAYAVSKRAA